MRISDWSSDVCSSDLEAAARALAEPDRGAGRDDDGEREAEPEIGEFDRQSPEIAEMEIIGRGGHLLPEMAVGEAYGAAEAPGRVESIACAVNPTPRMLGEKLDILAARAGVVWETRRIAV